MNSELLYKKVDFRKVLDLVDCMCTKGVTTWKRNHWPSELLKVKDVLRYSYIRSSFSDFFFDLQETQSKEKTYAAAVSQHRHTTHGNSSGV